MDALDPGWALIREELQRLLPRVDCSALHGRRLFLTGGTGFFGYWLLAALRVLRDLGIETQVQVLSRAPQRFLAANPEFGDAGDWLGFLEGDVRELGEPQCEYDWCIHAATDTSAAAAGRPLELFDSIVRGSRRVLEHARRAGASRVLLISSGAVYGNEATGQDAIAEDCPLGPIPTDPRQVYGEGKRAMEMQGALYNAAGPASVVSARCFAFVGPRLDLRGHFAIGNFIADALDGEVIEVKGTGAPVRSYLYIGDAVLWLLALLQRGEPGTAYNVGSGQGLSIAELARLTARVLAPEKPVRVLGAGPADNRRNRYVPEVARAASLGLSAWTDLTHAIQCTASYERLRRSGMCAMTGEHDTLPLISIVLGCFNEEENIDELYSRLKATVDGLPRYRFELLFIDNASSDGTVPKIKALCAADQRVRLIVNVRNFGHIRSPMHAVFQARGAAIVGMASDLQDPPELIPELVRRWEEGYKVVVGVKAKSEDTILMRLVRSGYYHLIESIASTRMIRDMTGFGLYDRQVIEIIRGFNDPYPYFRGQLSEIGFPVATIPFHKPLRKRGLTKNNFLTLYDLAMLGITSHSKAPIRAVTLLGFALAVLSLLIAFGYLMAKLLYWDSFQLGLAPALIGLFFFSSVQLFVIGLIGEYVGAIHTHVMSRPLVIEQERVNFEPEQSQDDGAPCA